MSQSRKCESSIVKIQIRTRQTNARMLHPHPHPHKHTHPHAHTNTHKNTQNTHKNTHPSLVVEAKAPFLIKAVQREEGKRGKEDED